MSRSREIPQKCSAFDFQIIGHTPQTSPVIMEHYANIDTGCVYNKEGLGKLTALHYPSMKIFQQNKID